MILIVLIACWILVVLAVAGLCLAARRGDLDAHRHGVSPAGPGPARPEERRVAARPALSSPTGAARARSRQVESRSLAGVGAARR